MSANEENPRAHRLERMLLNSWLCRLSGVSIETTKSDGSEEELRPGTMAAFWGDQQSRLPGEVTVWKGPAPAHHSASASSTVSVCKTSMLLLHLCTSRCFF